MFLGSLLETQRYGVLKALFGSALEITQNVSTARTFAGKIKVFKRFMLLNIDCQRIAEIKTRWINKDAEIHSVTHKRQI